VLEQRKRVGLKFQIKIFILMRVVTVIMDSYFTFIIIQFNSVLTEWHVTVVTNTGNILNCTNFIYRIPTLYIVFVASEFARNGSKNI